MEQKNNATPSSSLPEQTIPKIWYSSDTKFKTIFKFVGFNDKGTLEVFGDSLRFSGKKLNIRMVNIKNISLVGQKYLFLSIFFGSIVGLAIVSLFFWIWDRSFLIDHSSMLFVFLGPILGIGMTSSKLKWVCVEYSDENRINQKAYFISRGGSWRDQINMRGSEALYQSLKRFNKQQL
jgi:hypothetical protein